MFNSTFPIQPFGIQGMDSGLEPVDLTRQKGDEGKSQTKQEEGAQGNLNLWAATAAPAAAPWGGSSRSDGSAPGSTDPAGGRDGAGEQREGFGRRREPNTISWGLHQIACRGSKESTQRGSMGILQMLGAAGGAQLGDFPTSLLPSEIPAPGSHSGIPIQAGNLLLDAQHIPLSLTHTHTQREQQHHGRPRNGFGMAGKNPPCPASAAPSRCFSK